MTTREQEIGSALAKALAEEEQGIMKFAEHEKRRYDKAVAEQQKAAKELPALEKMLESKKEMLSKLEREIAELENRFNGWQGIAYDTGALSNVGMLKSRYETARYRADSFMASKINEIATVHR